MCGYHQPRIVNIINPARPTHSASYGQRSLPWSLRPQRAAPLGFPGTPLGFPDTTLGFPDTPLGFPDTPLGYSGTALRYPAATRCATPCCVVPCGATARHTLHRPHVAAATRALTCCDGYAACQHSWARSYKLKRLLLTNYY
eukprot:1180164-Prorocentrum_minimum.AAC.2